MLDVRHEWARRCAELQTVEERYLVAAERSADLLLARSSDLCGDLKRMAFNVAADRPETTRDVRMVLHIASDIACRPSLVDLRDEVLPALICAAISWFDRRPV